MIFYRSALLLTAVLGVLLTGCSEREEAGAAVASDGNAGVYTGAANAELPAAGELLYQTSLASEADTAHWIMEGEAVVEHRDGWMEMQSPNRDAHHVFWCPEDFPESFIASWEVQNLNPDAGLLIVFLAAKGDQGEDIFDPSLPARDGTFDQYTEGRIKSYHLSYYANVAHEPGRSHVNLRKNNTFSLLQSGGEGIAATSEAVHKIQLVKERDHIRLWIDGRKVIDYRDDQPLVAGVDTGPALGSGKIGFRQMQWSHFRYRNFQVHALAD